MNADTWMALATNFGTPGLFIGYLVWRELRQEKLAEKRIEADKALATSLALLDATVKGLR